MKLVWYAGTLYRDEVLDLLEAWVLCRCGGLTVVHEVNGHRRPAGELWFEDVWAEVLT